MKLVLVITFVTVQNSEVCTPELAKRRGSWTFFHDFCSIDHCRTAKPARHLRCNCKVVSPFFINFQRKNPITYQDSWKISLLHHLKKNKRLVSCVCLLKFLILCKKKRTWPISSHLNEQAWSITRIFFLCKECSKKSF